jgi:hypothetical protein
MPATANAAAIPALSGASAATVTQVDVPAMTPWIEGLRAEGCDGFLVGASGCALCSPCRKALGQPCSFPEYQFSCMSAYCIFVKKLTDKCGIEYDCGEGLLAFFGMYVFD